MEDILLSVLSVLAGIWIFKKFLEWNNVPPGPWGVPFLGCLPFIDRHHPHISLTELAHQYGPIYGINIGSIYTVVLSDHRLIREAFSYESLCGRAPLLWSEEIMEGHGIFSAEGGLWKDQRNLIMSFMTDFCQEKHSESRNALYKRIFRTVDGLTECLNETYFGELIDLNDMVTVNLGNVMNDIIFGVQIQGNDQTWNWLREIQLEGRNKMRASNVANFLPIVRILSPNVDDMLAYIARDQNQMNRVYASIIADRRNLLHIFNPNGAENIVSGHPSGHIQCFKYSPRNILIEERRFNPDTMRSTDGLCVLDHVLIEQYNRLNSDDDTAWYISDKQLYCFLSDIYNVSMDTTSATIAWLLLYTTIDREIQGRIQEELFEVFSEGNEDWDFTDLPYLMATIWETQRIRCISPFGIPHGCVQDTYIGGYRIPRGAMVVPLQWAINMDPDIWEDPETFNPDRFLDADRELVNRPLAFMPYQSGKRMCPAVELSQMIMYSVIAKLFMNWRVGLASVPPTKEEMMGTLGVTLAPPKVHYTCDRIRFEPID